VKHVITVFKKELIDTLRDRRTIITMIIIPLIAIPLMISITTRIQKSQMQKAKDKRLKVAVISNNNDITFESRLATSDDLEILKDIPEDSITSFIQAGKLDAAFVFSETFSARVADLKKGRLKLYFKTSDDFNIKKRRLIELVRDYETDLLAERFQKLNLDSSVTEAVNLVEVDVATTREKFGKSIGGFLPYMFVIFCFMGTMYPAIDLAAGEKERGTLETLLTAPVGRFQILVGKFAVVVLTGVTSALITIAGLYIAIRNTADVPEEVLEVIRSLLAPEAILLLLSLLLPLTIFFAGLLLSASIFAKSFKEAQSLVTPFTFIIIIPVVIGLIPGITLNPVTALVPVLNVSLATKEIVAGTINFVLLAEVYAVLILLALASLFVSSILFMNEKVIFRT